ncbi:MAG: hypothetical protein ACYCY6_02790 [Minisyncoccota bacterium]
MMKNKPENLSSLRVGIDGLKKVSMTPRQKGEIFHRLTRYTKKNPVVVREGLFDILLKPLRILFSYISWR